MPEKMEIKEKPVKTAAGKPEPLDFRNKAVEKFQGSIKKVEERANFESLVSAGNMDNMKILAFREAYNNNLASKGISIEAQGQVISKAETFLDSDALLNANVSSMMDFYGINIGVESEFIPESENSEREMALKAMMGINLGKSADLLMELKKSLQEGGSIKIGLSTKDKELNLFGGMETKSGIYGVGIETGNLSFFGSKNGLTINTNIGDMNVLMTHIPGSKDMNINLTQQIVEGNTVSANMSTNSVSFTGSHSISDSVSVNWNVDPLSKTFSAGANVDLMKVFY